MQTAFQQMHLESLSLFTQTVKIGSQEFKRLQSIFIYTLMDARATTILLCVNYLLAYKDKQGKDKIT